MASKDVFVGREYELDLLNQLFNRQVASLGVIKGRRRVGKSRLIEEFSKGKKLFQFSGLPPVDGMKAQDQRDEFSLQLSAQTRVPELKVEDWSKLFMLLAEQARKGKVVILLDEISWMAHNDKTFLPKLKNAWDLHFKKNPNLILILCGSISAWIEKNILGSTGYFGRVSLDLTVEELPLRECNLLLERLGFKGSGLEKYIILSLTGGIPWYLEQINPKLSAIENVKKLCFDKNGILVHEFRHIFHDLFGQRSSIYKKIVQNLAKRNLDYDELSEKLEYSKGSALTEYLSDLNISGFITQHHSWDLKTVRFGKRCKYRISDNYLRFYFKFMESKLKSILQGKLSDISVTSLPGWHPMIGLQFENLLLSNRELIHKSLSLRPEDIVADDPFFQLPTKRVKGCQVDYLIQTRYKTLYACEIKFSKNPIGYTVIKEMKEKLAKVSLPRGFAIVPVLIHLNDVTDDLADANYFTHIIDAREFLTE